MGLIAAKGKEAIESAAKQNLDLSKVMIRLKDKESVKVRLLSSEDFVEYQAIQSYELGVYTQPSKEPLTGKDYFVEAGKLAKAGAEGVDEKFSSLFPKKRYMIAMVDLATKELRLWDCSKSQFNSFVAALEDYKESIDAGEEIMFNFKRTGNKTETTYSLNPIFKPTKADKEAFAETSELEATIDFFESVLQPRSDELQVSVLKEAGFPVEKYFPEVDLTDKEADAKEDDAAPLDEI